MPERAAASEFGGWPGQALAYMVGRGEIQRLRAKAERELGPTFDIRSFHGVVLGNGAVPRSARPACRPLVRADA